MRKILPSVGETENKRRKTAQYPRKRRSEMKGLRLTFTIMVATMILLSACAGGGPVSTTVPTIIPTLTQDELGDELQAIVDYLDGEEYDVLANPALPGYVFFIASDASTTFEVGTLDVIFITREFFLSGHSNEFGLENPTTVNNQRFFVTYETDVNALPFLLKDNMEVTFPDTAGIVTVINIATLADFGDPPVINATEQQRAEFVQSWSVAQGTCLGLFHKQMPRDVPCNQFSFHLASAYSGFSSEETENLAGWYGQTDIFGFTGEEDEEFFFSQTTYDRLTELLK